MLLDIIGVDEFVMFAEPVIFPPIVAFVMFDPAVMLVSGVLMFCALTEFNPTKARKETIAARRGIIRTISLLIVCY